MKKTINPLLLLPFLFVLLSACGLLADESMNEERMVETEIKTDENVETMEKEKENLPNLDAEFKQIHEKGKLVVAMYSEDRFPYFFRDELGKLIGSDVDMAYDIARQLGIKEVAFDRSAKSYDEIVDLVAENQVDLAISKISITLNRAQQVLFSEPYLTLKQGVLLNRMQYAKLKTKQTTDPLQLLKSSRVKIGAVAGTSYMEFAQELFLSAEIIPFDTKEQMLKAVQNGEIIAAFYDEFEFKRYVNDNPDALIDLQLAVMNERKDYLAIAIPPENLRMQAWLKQYLAYRSPLDIDQVLNRYSDQQTEAAN